MGTNAEADLGGGGPNERIIRRERERAMHECIVRRMRRRPSFVVVSSASRQGPPNERTTSKLPPVREICTSSGHPSFSIPLFSASSFLVLALLSSIGRRHSPPPVEDAVSHSTKTKEKPFID